MSGSENTGRTRPASTDSSRAAQRAFRRPPRWLHYCLTVSMTAAALQLYLITSRAFDNQPAPIIFVIPIAISAYLGGLGPGLVATILSVLSADYFTTPPFSSFRIAHPVDYLRLGTLLAVGVLISLLSDSLLRAKSALQPRSETSAWLPLERKIRLTFGFAAICLLVIGIVSYHAVSSLRVNDELVDHTHQVLACLTKLLSTVTDGETGVRGYIITGDERFLQPYNSAMDSIAATQHELRGLTRDNPVQQRNLESLDPLIAERISILRTQIALRRTKGFAVAQADVATQRGKEAQDRIRAHITQMLDVETTLLKDRDARAQRSSFVAKIVILCGSLATLLVVIVALFVIGEDFSAKRRLEASLVEVHAELEERVVARTQALARINEQLRKSELQIRLMVSGVKDYAIFMLDADGFVASWNAGLHRLKGWAADEIVGQHFSRFYSPEDIADGLPARELEIAKAEGQFSGEGWRFRKDGSRFWANVVISPVRDDDGRLLGFSKVTRDTTEHRRIELAMKQEEARLAAVIGSAMDAVITADEQHLITLFNPAAEKMFGYQASAVLGTSLERLIPTRFRGSHTSYIHSFAKTNITRRKMGELTAIYGLRSNGEEFAIEASISQAQTDGQKIFSVILRDITERLKAEEARRVSETSFAMLVNQVPQFVWTCDPEGLNTYFNQRWVEYTGLTLEESSGRGWNTPFHPEDKQAAWDVWNRGARSGDLYSVESRLRAADGSYRWFLVRGEPVRGSDGNILQWLGTCTDIDAMKRAQAALLESEDRFRLFAEHAPAALAMFDRDMRHLHTSRRWRTDYGLGERELRGLPLYEVMPEIPERWKEVHRRALAGEVLRGEDDHFVRTDGSLQWMRWEARPWYDRTGAIGGIVLFAEEMTARKQAEGALHASEEKLRLAVEGARLGIWNWDLKTGELFGSPLAFALFGLPADTKFDFGIFLATLHPDDRGMVEAAMKRTVAEQVEYDVEYRCIWPNGTERWIAAKGHAYRDGAGESIRIGGIVFDVTERRRAQDALRRSDATRMLALDSARLGDWQLDLQTGLATRSLLHDEIFGYSEKQAEWNFDIFMSHVHPDDRERIARTFKECLDEQRKWDFECRILWPDQSLHWIWACGSHYRDETGRSTHVMGTVADITERKRSDELRLRSQKLEGLGTLSGGIAHDFNNILLAINGNAKLAIADLPPDHPVQQSLAEIAKASARATDLVRRILTFSRPGELKRQVCALQPIVEEALKLVRATIPATVEFRTAFAPHLPAVLADSTQIHQIIVNLATNAAHAIGSKSDGRIEVQLDSANLTADDMSPALNLSEGRYVRLRVSDNGCGMDRPTLNRIFDPFFTTKGPGEGTGLGLSVVHGIMKNHDGGISVYSEPGNGTAFRLFFPAVAATIAAAEEAPTPIQRDRTENILYVDDEEPLVMLVTRTLGRLGYKVTGQTDPVSAVELFRSDPAAFDVVVTDLAMPQLSGFDLSSQLLAIRPDIPIIMTSGFVRPEDQERALKMGLRDLILKPNTIDQLGRILDRVFQHEFTDQ